MKPFNHLYAIELAILNNGVMRNYMMHNDLPENIKHIFKSMYICNHLFVVKATYI